MFASASVTPRSSAQIVAWMPAKPTIAFRTMSGSRALEQLGRVAADLRERREAVDRRRARRRGDELELGVSPSITSSAWRPIEPVAPRRAIRLIVTAMQSR